MSSYYYISSVLIYRKMLQERGLATAGLKADLVERLKAAIESSGGGGGDSSKEKGGHSAAEGNEGKLRNLPSSLNSTAATAAYICYIYIHMYLCIVIVYIYVYIYMLKYSWNSCCGHQG